MMTSDERYLSRCLFKQEIYTRSGQTFEDFFIGIMRSQNPNFEAIKPQGRFGDRKNDGFDKRLGVYYQVYSPEDPASRENDAIRKLNEDFRGLYEYWNRLYPVKHFFFVINDKYKGVYASLQEQYSLIENEFPEVKCASFLAHNLEEVFLTFSLSECNKWIGLLPNVNIDDFDITILDEVVRHLLSEEVPISINKFPQNPDFDRKIEFNMLQGRLGGLLTTASLHDGALQKYFRVNSAFAKEDLRTKFTKLYQEGKALFKDYDNANDHVFFYILNNSSMYGQTKQNRRTQNAILVLMSYFFTYCDIFEEPQMPGQLSMFN